MIRPVLLALVLAGLVPLSAAAQDDPARSAAPRDVPPSDVPLAGEAPVIQLRTIAIIGNRELPKTLVIVPWKEAVVVPVPAPGIDSVLDAPAQALDPAGLALQVELFRAGYVLD